jgi:hypothetical protein
MTKDAALYSFFSGFGITACASTAVPSDIVFPYLTYTPIYDAWGGEPVSLTVNLWYYGASEKPANEKAQEISQALEGGKVLQCDEGFIWLHRGTPFCQNIAQEDNNNIKGRYLNITAEYLTHY